MKTVSVISLLCLVLFVTTAHALTEHELKALQSAVKEMCLFPDKTGDFLKVEGEAKAGLPVPVKIVKGQLSGKLTYEKWKGIPITLDKYKTDPRQCAQEMTKILLPAFSVKQPKPSTKEVKAAVDASTKDIPREVDYGYLELKDESSIPIFSDKHKKQMEVYGGEDFEYHIYTNYELPQVALKAGNRQYPLRNDSGVIKIVGPLNQPLKAFLVQTARNNSAAIKIQVKGVARPAEKK